MMERDGPLAGVRVLAVEQFGAGPFGTALLAELGAEVIKIEDPRLGGDIARYVPPGQADRDSLFFETFNQGKRSIALDLTETGDRALFERLVTTADAVFSNLRGDLPDRLGLTYATLGRVNAAIVCVSLTGYGRTGPRAAWPAYDALVQAEAGWAALTGQPDGPPTKSGLSLADYAAGAMSMVGLLAALLAARTSGRGSDVDVSLLDTALSMLTYPATWRLSAGIETDRLPMSAHPSIVPFQFFATKDGHVAIACAKDRFFRALVEALELNELAADPRFADFAGRLANRDVLLEILAGRLATRTTAEWLTALGGRVPIAPVRSLAEATDRDALEGRGLLRDYQHPALGRVSAIGSAIRVAGHVPASRRAPRFDEDGPALRESLAARDAAPPA
ncbi:MAG TPA: CoA transferase [Patescibacteria group bacterium]|nr:CoA transferase [Patescibacteria group bacterium]